MPIDRRISFLLFIAGIFILAARSPSQTLHNNGKAPLPNHSTVIGTPRYALLNINNLTSWMRADGLSNHSPKGDDRAYFPRGTANVIYQDGILWGGKAYLDSAKTQPAPFAQLIRVGGTTYSTGCREGWIHGFGANAQNVDPADPRARIYRIRRDYFTMTEDEMRRDAAETYEVKLDAITSTEIQAVKGQYEKDWAEWPVDLGAPYIDRNGNGVYDPPPPFETNFTTDDLIAGSYDEPGVSQITPDAPADQVIWAIYNDLDPNSTLGFAGSEPLGLEVQLTVWGYISDGALGNAFFRRAKIINKGGVTIDTIGTKGAFWIDSMYVGQFSDPDIGNAGDDLVGCDTLLGLGYAYTAHATDGEFQKFNLPPPAVGYVLLQGPRITSPGDSAFFDFKKIDDARNLSMTSFGYRSVGSPIDPPFGYSMTRRLYHWLKGYMPVDQDGLYYPFPLDLTPNHFPLSGDPVTRRGFIDGLGVNYSFAESDRRILISSGPFTFAPGDTQEVVFAFVAGHGADRLSSITHLKFLTKQLRLWYPYQGNLAYGAGYQPPPPELPSYFSLSRNYPNPFNGGTRIDYTIPHAGEVKLTIYDVLGREVVVLEHAIKEAGDYSAFWDGSDDKGRIVPSGVYFYRLQAFRYRIELTKKLLVLK